MFLTHPAPQWLKSLLLCSVYTVNAAVTANVRANAKTTEWTSYMEAGRENHKPIHQITSRSELALLGH